MSQQNVQDLDFARAAVRSGLVPLECLDEALAELASRSGRSEPVPSLEDFLVEKGWLSRRHREQARAEGAAVAPGASTPIDPTRAVEAESEAIRLLVDGRFADRAWIDAAMELRTRLAGHGLDFPLAEVFALGGLLGTAEPVVEGTAADAPSGGATRCPLCRAACRPADRGSRRPILCPTCRAAAVSPTATVEAPAAPAPPTDLTPPTQLPRPPARDGLTAITRACLADPSPPDVPPPLTLATVPGAHAAVAPTDLAAALAPSTRLGRYRLDAELGRGGMGLVYRAFDEDLRRVVALKTLLPDTVGRPDAVERFLREARAAARLLHPGIVHVHDVGSVEGRPYFTMDFIEGDSFEAARAGMATRRFLEVLRAVAEALGAAHASGVVHRDVKPANVLLDRAGRAFVGDFGLVKEVLEGGPVDGLTASGTAIGTPHYMSPEQAQGEPRAIGPWSDVWSLGVMLYEHLSGRKPFDGESFMALLIDLLSNDPVPPSRVPGENGGVRRVHRDLETICLKCLEKEPRSRYRDGAALAAELGRFLDGEPIEARAASRTDRALRWVRRRPALASALGAFGVAVLVAGHYAWQARVERLRARRSVLESALVQEVRAPLAEALGARRGGELRLLTRVVSEAEARADRRLAEEPSLAEAHFLKGWLYRLTGRLPEARRELDRADELRPGDLATRHERGLVHAARFREVYADARRAWQEARFTFLRTGEQSPATAAVANSTAQPEPSELERLRPELVEARRLAEQDFAEAERLRNAAGGKDLLGQAAGACGRGLLALHRGDLEVALTELDAALAADPFLDEAHQGKLQALRMALAHGDVRPPDVVAAYDRALDANKGITESWVGSAEVRGACAEWRIARGEAEPAFAAWREAEEHLGRAMALAPGRADLSVHRCRLLTVWAYALQGRGPGSGELLARVVELADGVIRRDAKNGAAHYLRAMARLYQRQGEAPAGADLLPPYREAAAELAHALELAPDDAEVWCGRAVVRLGQGDVAQTRRLDAQPAFLAAIQDLDQAVRLRPDYVFAWQTRGMARLRLADAREATFPPQDPRPVLRKAIVDFDEVLRLAPRSDAAYAWRGKCRRRFGDADEKRGLDPTASFAAAIEDIEAALRLNPRSAETIRSRGNTRLALAVARRRQGADARGDYRQAIADYDAALASEPLAVNVRLTRGQAWRRLGEAEAARGEDPGAAYECARADLDAAVAAGLPEAHLQVGYLLRALGRLDEGLEAFKRARELSPSDQNEAFEAIKRTLDQKKARGTGEGAQGTPAEPK